MKTGQNQPPASITVSKKMTRLSNCQSDSLFYWLLTRNFYRALLKTRLPSLRENKPKVEKSHEKNFLYQ